MTENNQKEETNLAEKSVDNNNTMKFYKDSKDYWSKIEPTVNGMLGGYEHVSTIDIATSQDFLNVLIKNHGLGNKMAFDGGAGIGRVTKNLLLKNFDKVEMLDPIENFIDNAKTYLGIEQAARIERFHVCGLEQFHPEPNKYDCIWLQWCTGYLTDNDFVDFLKRCKTSLTEHGMCVIKDNITKIEADFDNTDSSFTRTRQNLKDCIHKARMRIVVDEKQYGFPAELYEVRMLAFK